MSAEFDIEAYMPPAITLPSTPPRRPYKVLAFHGGYKELMPRNELVAAIIDAPALRAATGWDRPTATYPADEIILSYSRNGQPLLEPRYPRNVPWTSLPHVGAPHWRTPILNLSSLELATKRGEMPPIPPHEILQEVEHLVFAWGYRDQTRRLASVIDMEAFAGHRFQVHTMDAHGITPVPREQIEAAALEIRADTRFAWNWHWNVGMLLPALVAQAYHTRRPPVGQYGRLRDSWEHHAIEALQQHPLALQMLFWVQRENAKPLPYDQAVKHGDRSAILSGAGFTRQMGEQTAVLDWTGHKVEAVEFGIRESRAETKSDFLRTLEFAVERLIHVGLLVADKDRRARLSPAGAELLRLLPPGCRDLGMATRWITPQGRWGTPDDIPAMDRWLTTMLRHIKKAANALPQGV